MQRLLSKLATPGLSPGVGRPMRLPHLVECVLASEPWECSPFAVELQRAVRAISVEMRERGSTPEQVIIALKHATARSAWRPITTAADALHYRMTLWAIREFFRCDR